MKTYYVVIDTEVKTLEVEDVCADGPMAMLYGAYPTPSEAWEDRMRTMLRPVEVKRSEAARAQAEWERVQAAYAEWQAAQVCQ